jgi:hypothetical protein
MLNQMPGNPRLGGIKPHLMIRYYHYQTIAIIYEVVQRAASGNRKVGGCGLVAYAPRSVCGA